MTLSAQDRQPVVGVEVGADDLQHHPLRADLVAQMDQAIRADERAKRYLTRSAWIQDAVRAAIADADQRAGRRLPNLPAGTRLPNQPRTTGK